MFAVLGFVITLKATLDTKQSTEEVIKLFHNSILPHVEHSGGQDVPDIGTYRSATACMYDSCAMCTFLYIANCISDTLNYCR